jgi:hypothetical protein
MDKFGSWRLDANSVDWIYQYFQYNTISLFDNLLLIDIPSYTGSYFKLHKLLTTNLHKNYQPGLLLVISKNLMRESVNYEREVFNIFDLIGELGGVIEVFIVVFGVFFYPISNHSFLIKASQMLFYARTEDKELFIVDQNQ